MNLTSLVFKKYHWLFKGLIKTQKSILYKKYNLILFNLKINVKFIVHKMPSGKQEGKVL